jgi:hypothetical protein
MENTELVPDQYRQNYESHSKIETLAKQLALAIKDESTYREACEFRVEIQSRLKGWMTVIKPAVDAAFQSHKKIKAVENKVAEPLENALGIMDPSITKWRRDQEAARQLEQEKINRELRKQEEDRRLAQAAELEKSGKHDEAKEIFEAPIEAPQVILPTATKVAGISDRTYWSAEMFDIVKLCRAIADGKADKSCVKFNETLFNGMARSMKSAMNAEWEPKGVRAISRADIA